MFVYKAMTALADVGGSVSFGEVDGDMLYIRAVLTPKDCDSLGITVKSNGKRDETTFTYDVSAETINGTTSNKGAAASAMVINGSLPLKAGQLAMELFIDRSLVEGFFNADKSVCVRAYGKRKSRQIFLFADGEVNIESLEVYDVKSIY